MLHNVLIVRKCPPTKTLLCFLPYQLEATFRISGEYSVFFKNTPYLPKNTPYSNCILKNTEYSSGILRIVQEYSVLCKNTPYCPKIFHILPVPVKIQFFEYLNSYCTHHTNAVSVNNTIQSPTNLKIHPIIFQKKSMYTIDINDIWVSLDRLLTDQ